MTVVSEKILRFQNKNRDLGQLASQIQERLQADGYKVQYASTPIGRVIQAQKGGILRDAIDANRAFTIMVAGEPNDFTVHIGIGKWIQNLAVVAVETLFLSWLFLPVDIPEILWTVHVEDGIARQIAKMAG